MNATTTSYLTDVPAGHDHAASSTCQPATSFVMPPLLRGSAALQDAAQPASWLWHGYLVAGAVTVLTSRWKAGKTTLVSVLLARLKLGGLLAGLPLAAGRAVVVTEEGPEHWQRRHAQLDFGDHVGWFCRPFHGRPTLPDWSAFVDGLAALHQREPFALLVIDPLAGILPGNENSAASMLNALAPLQRLTERGVSVLMLHHPSKGDPPLGEAARGSGALSGFADILIEMRAPSHPRIGERRRKLWALSRFPETPRQLVIEWSGDGSDYIGHGTFLDEDFTRHWQKLLAVFNVAPHKLTRADVLRRWRSANPPSVDTLKRWLRKALSQGLLLRDGEGVRSKPYRYWTPASEVVWRKDPFAWMLMPELRPQEPDSSEDVASVAPPSAPDPAPEPTASAAPEPLRASTAEPVSPSTPEEPLRLPNPFNIMNPAKVPEWVWKQVRAAREKT